MNYESAQNVSRKALVMDPGLESLRYGQSTNSLAHSELAKLYKTYNEYIICLLRKQGWSREASEDAVHEVIKRLIQKPKLLKDIRHFTGFVIVCSRRHLINECRRVKRFEDCVEAIKIVWQMSPGVNESDLDDATVWHKKIRSILEYLNPKARRVLELRLFYGMTLNAISTELDIPYGTVAAIWRRFLLKRLPHKRRNIRVAM